MTSLKAALPHYLYTNRLVLEVFRYSEAHYKCLLDAMNSRTAHTNMGDFNIRTPAQFDALNASTRLSSSVCGGRTPDTDLYYLIRLGNKSGPLTGGVSLAQRAGAIPPDMGWCILEEYMGNEYAVEAGKELLRFVTEELGVNEVMTWPGIGNQRSLRVAQKIGFVAGGTIRDNEGALHVVYILPGMQFNGDMAFSLWGERKHRLVS